MKSPVNSESLEYIRTNLYKVIDCDEKIINFFDLTKKCNLFTTSQLSSLVSEISNSQIRVLIITKIFGNVLDRSNFKEFKRNCDDENQFMLLCKLINSTYDKNSIYENDENFVLYKKCTKELEKDELFFVKKRRERENLVSTQDGNLSSTLEVEEDSISEKELKNLINEMKDIKDFKSMRSKIGIKTISVNNSIKLIKRLKEELHKMEFVIAIYPCLNDPHNIETLINYISLEKIQNECRVKLLKLPNLYFDIIGGEVQHEICCCIIF